MKIAIQHPCSSSQYWIEYCKKGNINYKLVNAFESDIIEQVKDCDAFMWHHSHMMYKDVITAKKVLFSLEHSGKKVYPNFNTCWHFDDKIGQKYLLEAIDAPLVPSYVFYDKTDAIKWARNTSYPKVFKLTGGAGSKNVLLVKNKKTCFKLIKKAFGRGFTQSFRSNLIKDDFLRFKKTYDPIHLLKAPARFFIKSEYARMQSRDKGYVYFQDFVPDNMFDIRVVVVGGEKAPAEKRFVRKNDFRASGSGEFCYDGINIKAIQIAFHVVSKLNLQSIAFDFVFDKDKNPLIVEMSYGFGTAGISKVPGYWDNQLNWHEGNLNFHELIVERLINDIK